jgi:hypothetical protein
VFKVADVAPKFPLTHALILMPPRPFALHPVWIAHKQTRNTFAATKGYHLGGAFVLQVSAPTLSACGDFTPRNL